MHAFFMILGGICLGVLVTLGLMYAPQLIVRLSKRRIKWTVTSSSNVMPHREPIIGDYDDGDLSIRHINTTTNVTVRERDPYSAILAETLHDLVDTFANEELEPVLRLVLVSMKEYGYNLKGDPDFIIRALYAQVDKQEVPA